jgi:restriction endonuclease Mrr
MIPSYEEIMLPLLNLLSDKQEHTLQEADDASSASCNVCSCLSLNKLRSGNIISS